MTIDRSKRTTFEDKAELYDQVRPGNPNELVEDILALSGIPDTGRILEIGCGSGNATIGFARRGYRMVCIELGERLATLAAKNCSAYPKVEILNTAFEDWEIEDRAFDLAISGEAFHWIPPEIGYPKVARALKDGGSAAFFWILYLEPDTDFFRAMDEVYSKRVPGFENPNRTMTVEWLTERIEENFESSNCFGKVTVRQYPWSEEYTGEQYVKLTATFSSHQGLDESTKEGLFADMTKVIERFGGTAVSPYVGVLFHAKVKR